MDKEKPQPESQAAQAPPAAAPWAWCLAANVILERTFGPGRSESRSGTRHFAPGAKVYVVSFFWGMGGDRLSVLGRQRKSGRWIRVVTRSRWLVNWRAEKAYAPRVVREILDHHSGWRPGEEAWAQSEEAREQVERILHGLREGHETGAATQPFNTRPPHQDGRAQVLEQAAAIAEAEASSAAQGREEGLHRSPQPRSAQENAAEA